MSKKGIFDPQQKHKQVPYISLPRVNKTQETSGRQLLKVDRYLTGKCLRKRTDTYMPVTSTQDSQNIHVQSVPAAQTCHRQQVGHRYCHSKDYQVISRYPEKLSQVPPVTQDQVKCFQKQTVGQVNFEGLVIGTYVPKQLSRKPQMGAMALDSPKGIKRVGLFKNKGQGGLSRLKV